MEQVKQFITWIGGAVAGLTLLFYAAGYLVYRAHINMLGLAGVVEYPHEQLLYEGAKFYFTVGAYLLKSFFILGIAISIVAIFGMLLRHVGWIDRAATRAASAARGAIVLWNERRPALLRACLLAVLGAVFVLHTDRFFYPLEDLHTGIEHLLYAAPPAALPAHCALPGGAARNERDMIAAVTLWLQQGEACRNQLLGEFRRLLAGYLVLLVAAYFALRHQGLRHTAVYRVGTVTLAVYGALYTLLLPVAFGVLVRSPIYPTISIKSKDGTGEGAALHLLNRQGNVLLVWDAASRKAAWLPADAAAVEIDVLGQGNILAAPKPGAAP